MFYELLATCTCEAGTTEGVAVRGNTHAVVASADIDRAVATNTTPPQCERAGAPLDGRVLEASWVNYGMLSRVGLSRHVQHQ